MAYPESCFVNLIGIKGICDPYDATYWLNDIPGIDVNKLARGAEGDASTGEKLGLKLIDTAARMVIADVEAIYDASYKVQAMLTSGCSVCKFSANYAAGPQKGMLIKNNSTSHFSSLVLSRLNVKLNSTGTFTIIITDGITSKSIEREFIAGVEYELQNLSYETKEKQIKIYIDEADALLYTLSCPSNSTGGCGCSGPRSTSSELTYTGLTAGVESQNAYGFLPCAFIRCNAEDLICFIAKSAPRMVGMALLFKTAELYFTNNLHVERNNRTIGTNNEMYKKDVDEYKKMYKDKLQGVGTRGVKDLVFSVLQQNNDVCVLCNSINSVAWATG